MALLGVKKNGPKFIYILKYLFYTKFHAHTVIKFWENSQKPNRIQFWPISDNQSWIFKNLSNSSTWYKFNFYLYWWWNPCVTHNYVRSLSIFSCHILQAQILIIYKSLALGHPSVTPMANRLSLRSLRMLARYKDLMQPSKFSCVTWLKEKTYCINFWFFRSHLPIQCNKKQNL